MKENTSDRLKKIMEERKIKQVDILNMSLPYCRKYNIKMNKSDISQYVSGKVEPSQEKLVILGMALDVSEAWLMGLYVISKRKEVSYPHFFRKKIMNECRYSKVPAFSIVPIILLISLL